MTKLWILSLLTFLFALLPLITAFCSGSCNHGSCQSSQCICNTGYFNSGNGVQNCVQTATAIQKGTYNQYDILYTGGWYFFYISLSGIESYVKVDFKLDQGELDAYSLLQLSDEFDVPTPTNYDSSFTVYSIGGGGTAVYKLYTETQVSNTNGGWLVIALQNNYGSDIELNIQYETDSTSDGSSGVSVRNIIIGVAVAAGVIFLIALCAYRRIRRMRRMQNHIRQRAANRRRASQDIEAAHRLRQEENHQHQNHPPVDPNQNYAPVLNPNQNYAPVLNPNQAHLLANQNNRPAQPHQHHPGHRPPGHVQPQPQQPQARPLAPASNLLTKEEIQKYFPKKPFKELETPFPQTTCSICIDEFRPEANCHQLYCHHIFHEACIEAWLAKHDSCPDCRKPITRKAIREFLKAEKKRKEEELRAANKVKVMKESVRASKSIHKAQTLQRRGSDHQVHQPQP